MSHQIYQCLNCGNWAQDTGGNCLTCGQNVQNLYRTVNTSDTSSTRDIKEFRCPHCFKVIDKGEN